MTGRPDIVHKQTYFTPGTTCGVRAPAPGVKRVNQDRLVTCPDCKRILAEKRAAAREAAPR